MENQKLIELLTILREAEVAKYKTTELELVLHAPTYQPADDDNPENWAEGVATRGVHTGSITDPFENPELYGDGVVPSFAGDK